MTKKDDKRKREGSNKAVGSNAPLGDADPMVTPVRDMYLSPKRQCTAMSKASGKQCGRYAMLAQRVCYMHGGATKQAKAKAAERIREASGYAADMLVEFMADPDSPRELRTKIAQDLLDRGGVNSKTVLQIGVETPKSFEDWVGESLVLVDDDDPNVIDAEVIEEDDTAPPRDLGSLHAGNRHDRALAAEVERAARGRAREQAGGSTRAELERIEREALGLAPSQPRSHRHAGGDSNEVHAMNAQQDREDEAYQRVRDAERRRNEERHQNRRARTSEATMSQPKRRGARR